MPSVADALRQSLRDLLVYLTNPHTPRRVLVVLAAGWATAFFLWTRAHPQEFSYMNNGNVLPRPDRMMWIKIMLAAACGLTVVWLGLAALLARLTRGRFDETADRHAAALAILLLLLGFAILSLAPPAGYAQVWFVMLLAAATYLIARDFQKTWGLPLNPLSFFKPFAVLLLAVLAALAYGIYFGTLSLSKHDAYHSTALDLGIYDQIMYSIVHTGRQLTTLAAYVEPLNFASKRMTPILYLLAPIYALFPGAKTLLVLQSVFLASGGVAVFLLARQTAKNSAAALLLAFSFLLHPALHSAHMFDFHEVVMAVPALLFMFYFLEAERWRPFYVFLILSLMVREEIALTGVLLGVHMLMNKRQLRHGLIVFCGSAVYFVGALSIMRWLGNQPEWDRFQNFVAPGSAGMKGLLATLLTNPWWVFQNIIFFDAKMLYLFKLLLPMALLPLLVPAAWIVAGAALAIPLLSNYESQYSLGAHYGILPLITLYYLAALGLARVGAERQFATGMAVLMASLLLNHFYGKVGDRPYPREARLAGVEALLEKIPPDGSVAAMPNLVPHVSSRAKVLELPHGFHADYILFDTVERGFYYGRQAYTTITVTAEQLLRSKDYGLLGHHNGVLLLKRGHAAPLDVKALSPLLNLQYEAESMASMWPLDNVNFPDPKASGGMARAAGPHTSGGGALLFGPYINIFKGDRCTVTFMLKVTNNERKSAVCVLDATGHSGQETLAAQTVYASDFKQPNEYQPFVLTFTVHKDTPSLETRVFNVPGVTLVVDTVKIEREPTE